MAGYTSTPLATKLGIKEGHQVVCLAAPPGFPKLLAPLPPAVKLRSRLGRSLDVLVFFTREREELERRFDGLREAIAPAGGLWIAWPKKSSGVDTDLTEDVVREIALAGGLVDNKVCAIDETWSGLRLVYRLRDRPS
jgi:hypothetical protein